MKTFHLFPLLALAQAGYPAKDGHGTGCIDISFWGPVQWTSTDQEFCTYTCQKNCEPMSKSVCAEVPVTSCELVGYTDCVNTPHTQTVRKDEITKYTFRQKECVDGPIKPLVEIKEMPVCRNVTTEKCDSKWVIDEKTGEKVWAGNVNCEDVVWQDCELQQVEIIENVPTFDCFDGQPIQYDHLVETSEPVSTYTTTCEAKVVPVCSTTTRQECTTVMWEECSDSIEPDCNSFPFKVPEQKADHTLRCPLHH